MPYPTEIKANIEGAVADALAKLGNPDGASKRQIWFAEDRDGLADGELRLLKGGVIIRIRSGDGPDDSTAKLRPCEQTQLRKRWAAPFDGGGVQYRIEGDWSGQKRSLAASAVSTFSQGSQAQVGGSALHAEALVKSQVSFLRRCADIPVSVDRLIALGPIASTKWSDIALAGMSVNAERWSVADLDFLELLVRVKPKTGDTAGDFDAHARKRQARLLDTIGDLGIQIAVNVDNKTQRALTALASAVHH